MDCAGRDGRYERSHTVAVGLSEGFLSFPSFLSFLISRLLDHLLASYIADDLDLS